MPKTKLAADHANLATSRLGKSIPVLQVVDILFEMAVELEIKRLRFELSRQESYILQRCKEVIEFQRIAQEALVQMAIRGHNIR